MSALVICSHLPGEGHFRSERFRVEAVCCRDDFDYHAGLAKRWDSDATIVNLEHDVEAIDDHLAALLDCPEPLCAWAYLGHWGSTGLSYDVIVAGTGDRNSVRDPKPGYLTGDEEWAAWSAIGLMKIAPEARIGPLRREPWPRVELAVHEAVKRPWHMHWPPVDHWHF